MTANGKANWVYVSLSERNERKVLKVLEKPLRIRCMKLFKLFTEITDMTRILDRADQSLDKTEEKPGELRTQDEQKAALANERAILKKKALNYNKLLSTINNSLLDKYCTKLGEAPVPDGCPTYRVVDFRPHEGTIHVQRMFDQNRLLLSTRQGFNVESVGYLDFFNDFEIASADQQQKLRQEILNTHKHRLFIRYFVDGRDCYPEEVRPERINFSDYQPIFDAEKGRITSIRNLRFQTDVLFYDMTMKQLQGHVKGSVMHIWTVQVDHETLNILHIHVNDTSDAAAFDTAYVHEGETLDQFTDFKTDSAG